MPTRPAGHSGPWSVIGGNVSLVAGLSSWRIPLALVPVASMSWGLAWWIAVRRSRGQPRPDPPGRLAVQSFRAASCGAAAPSAWPATPHPFLISPDVPGGAGMEPGEVGPAAAGYFAGTLDKAVQRAVLRRRVSAKPCFGRPPSRRSACGLLPVTAATPEWFIFACWPSPARPAPCSSPVWTA